MRLKLIGLLVFFIGNCFAQDQSELELKRMQWKDSYTAKAQKEVRNIEVTDGLSDFADSMQRLYFVDTFVVNRVYEEMNTFDGSTLGMNQANMYCTGDYEALVQKYTKIIFDKLLPDDKKLFEDANQAWNAYFEKQKALVGALMQPIYNGGGTIQTIIYTNRLKNMQQERLQELMDLLKDFV